MDEEKQEPNWTELLEKEYGDNPVCRQIIEAQRAGGHSDKETYLALESFS